MLSVSRTSGYAILALSELVEPDTEWTLAERIREKTDIPGPYLSKILHALSAANLVVTKRGYRGGTMLARPADRILVLEIVDAVDGPDWMGECLLGQAYCSDDRACPTHDFWKIERERIGKFLGSLTLAEVAAFQRDQGNGSCVGSVQRKKSKATNKAEKKTRPKTKTNKRSTRRSTA